MRPMAPAQAFLAPLCLVLTTVLLAACAGSLLGGRADLELTFDHAVIALPPTHQGGAVRLGQLEEIADPDAISGRRPVVIYLHGCTGIGNYGFFKVLAGAGYVVVAPDSMARRFRPLQCDPRTNTGGHNLFIYDFRRAEIAYALQRLRRYSWIDWSNVFLIGTSEGGVAAALYRGDEFRARVIAQWTCIGGALVRGIAAPPETPILAIVRNNDPWYDPARTAGQRGDCGAFMASRPGSRSIVLSGRQEHDVFGDPEIVREILRFLQANRSG